MFIFQCDNFVRFLELCILNCLKLKVVKLVTGKDVNGAGEQAKRLAAIKESLQNIPERKKQIELEIEYSEVLHDREIRFNNGWVVKIGRGLDYFKQMDRFKIGFSDFDLRHCRATTIDIFHKKEFQKYKR